MSDIVTMFTDNVSAYVKGIETLGGDRKTQQAKFAAKRDQYANNITLIDQSDKIVEGMLTTLREVADVSPDILPALYNSVVAKFVAELKIERDMFLNGNTGTAERLAELMSTTGVSVESLTQHKTIAESLFGAILAMGLEIPEEIKTEKSKKTGQVRLVLPRLPKGTKAVNSADRTAARKKVMWTVDGRQYAGYTLASMRKVITNGEGGITVQDIKDALKWSDQNVNDGKPYMFNMCGKVIIYQAIDLMTADQIAAIDDDEEDDDETDED